MEGNVVKHGISLTISDTGIGIAPEDLGRLGQPFEQVETIEAGQEKVLLIPLIGGASAVTQPTSTANAPQVTSLKIGGTQTGNYPSASPGGWHLLGRCGARLFDPQRAEPALLRAGDRVRFRPVAANALAHADVEVRT